MNNYQKLQVAINKVRFLNTEEISQLGLCRIELSEFLKRHGEIGSLALYIVAMHAAIQEQEAKEQATQENQ